MKQYVLGVLVGIITTFCVTSNAGFIGSALGGAGGAALATAGIESKVDTINARIDALTRALDSTKICKK